jgi:hypothetical protein
MIFGMNGKRQEKISFVCFGLRSEPEFSSATFAVAVVGLLYYFKKRKRQLLELRVKPLPVERLIV